MQPLFSAHELTALQQFPLAQMTATVVIKRPKFQDGSLTTNDNDWGSELSYAAADLTVIATVKGWLYSTPESRADEDAGAIVTSDLYRMYVPIGTAILPKDQIEVGAGPDIYEAVDTTAASTWPALLNVSMRRRK